MSEFTPGNLVVYRVGTGASALSSAATTVFVDEYTTAGVLVQSIQMPTADSGAQQTLTASGSATSEGLLTLSADGRYVVLTGYDAAPGTASVASSSTSGGTPIVRVIGRIGADGTVDTSTTTTAFSGNNIRGVASADGSGFWAVGAATGVVYQSFGGTGAGTVVGSNFTNLRSVEIFDGQLYVSSGSGALRMGAVGTGTPTTTGQTITSLAGFPTGTLSPYQYYLADLTEAVAGVDTLYLADDRAVASGGGLLKYSLVSGSWVSNGTASGSLGAGLRGLTGSTDGTSVSFFATDAASTQHIVSLTDAGGYNAAFSATSFTTIATAAANTAFRGIAFTPEAPTISIQATPVAHAEGNGGTTEFVFTVTRSEALGDVTVNYAVSGSGGLDASDFVGGVLPSGTVSFIGSNLTAQVIVQVQGDAVVEGDENFTVTLSNPGAGYAIGSTSAQTGTITNDDTAAPALGAGSIAFTGFNGDGSDAIAWVALEDIAAGQVIYFTDKEWTGAAFNSGEGQLVWTATSAVSAGTVVTITNFDTSPVASTGSTSGSSGLSSSSEIVYAHIGTATTPTAFLAAIASNGFTIEGGTLTGTGLVVGETAIDLAGGVAIGAYNGARSGPADFADYAAIINTVANWQTQSGSGASTDGTAPSLPFSNAAFSLGSAETQSVGFAAATVAQAEGASGTTAFTFTVTRTGGTTGALDFSGSVSAGDTNAADYAGGTVPTSFSGTIADGQASATVTINVQGDTAVEANENFALALTGVTNLAGVTASINGGASSATGTIQNDDLVLGLGSIAFTGFNSDGNDDIAFVALEDIPSGTVIYFSDREWTGSAFNTGEGELAWTAGSTIVAGTVVTISSYSASPTSNLGTVTGSSGLSTSGEIVYAFVGAANTPAAFLAAVANNGFAIEGGTLTGTGLVVGETAIDLAAIGGTPDIAVFNGARFGEDDFADYAAVINTASNWIAQDASGDQHNDSTAPDLPFSTAAFTLGAPPAQAIEFAAGSVSVSKPEIDSGNVTYTFTITRSGATTGAVTVTGTLTPGTDVDAADFGGSLPGFTATIADGQASGTFSLTVSGDDAVEIDESFTLTITGGTNSGGAPVTVGANAVATGTILNDDAGATIGGVTVYEAAPSLEGDATPPAGSDDIVLVRLGAFEGSGATLAGRAESVAFDAANDRIYVTNAAQDRVDVAQLNADGSTTALASLDLSGVAGIGTINSVAIKNGVVAVAYDSATAGQPGAVALYNAAGTLLNTVPTGVTPDQIIFTPDGQRLLVANEAEAVSAGNNPAGSIMIVDLSGGAASASVIGTIDFAGFTGLETELAARGLALMPGQAAGLDIEPEYITVSPDGTRAYATLQEVNAVAVIDLTTPGGSLVAIQALGGVDHNLAGNAFDPSDQNGVSLITADVISLLQPDAIASFTVAGTTYFITANEGDARVGSGLEGVDVVRVNSSYTMDPGAYPNAATLEGNGQLGRLNVLTNVGDTDFDGDYDQVYGIGGRGISIFRQEADGSITKVRETGGEFEAIIARDYASLFNQNQGSGTVDGRSDDKGPEPEGVVVGQVGDRLYAFVTLERTGGVMVYDVTDPANATFVTYRPATGALFGPETVTFVGAADSPTGGALLFTADEISGSTDIYRVVRQSDGADTIEGAGGADSFNGRAGNDTIQGFGGNDTIDGGADSDTVRYNGNRADYAISATSGTYTVADTRGGTPDGTDSVTNVEFYAFADGIVAVADLIDSGATGSVSIADAQIVEGANGTSVLQLTVTRSGGGAAFSVDFATSDGGAPNNAAATAGSDYVAANGTLNVGLGQNTATVSVTINGDTVLELSEQFTVTLSGATNGATIADGSAVATITNDEVASASQRIFEEDFTGFTAAGFAPSPTAAQLDSDIWRVAGLSDSPTPAYGFTNTTGDFARGTITTNDPTTAGVYSPAANGALVVQPTGAEMEANGFIEARVANTTGVTVTAFDVDFDWVYRNSGDRASNLAFSWSTDGTSFTAVPAAAFSTPSTLTAGAVFTNVDEALHLSGLSVADGGFLYLRWTHANSTGSSNRDEVGIDNLTVDAAVPAAPTVTVSDVSVNEADGTMTFTVTRANLVEGAFTVDFATANGTATAGQDYTATDGTLSFAANQAEATVTVAIANDGDPEFAETLFLNLSNPTGGVTIADAQAVGTITSDDGAPIAVAIDDVTITEGNDGTSIATFTVTRTSGTGAFTVDYASADASATAGSDYVAVSDTLSFAAGENSKTISVTINGDLDEEATESFTVNLSDISTGVIADGQGVGTITNDDATLISSIQGGSYFSPLLAADGVTAFNTASSFTVTVQAVVTAVDNDGDRQGFYITEETTDWDGNVFSSEGIFVMTRSDALVGSAVSGVAVGDLVTVTANVMEYQGFATNMPITALVNPTGITVDGTADLPVLTLDESRPIPNEMLTGVTPNYLDSVDDANDSFDGANYALSFFESVEGMLVTIPEMRVADGFVSTSGGQPYFKAYSTVHANADQINDRGGYTIAGDPPLSPPDTDGTGDDTIHDGRHLHDGDINPDIIELDFSGFAIDAPAGLTQNATMGDQLGDVTGIIDFEFTDLKLFVTDIDAGSITNGVPVQEVTTIVPDARALNVAAFNVENLDPGDGADRFAAIAQAIAVNLKAPDIISIEEMQDNNGAAAGDGISGTGTDASTSWQMLVDALNAAVPGAAYQWVDQAPVYNAEGGEQSGNIRVGFLYNTNRVQLGNLAADATIDERRQFTDRVGDNVRDAGDQILVSDNMVSGISTSDWAGTRKSLLGQFTFAGQNVFVLANHLPSKGGSGEFWQFNQNLETGQPSNSDWDQRSAIGEDIYSLLSHVQAQAPNAGIVAGGDFNDFYFYRPLEAATGYVYADGTVRNTGARLDNLTVTELSEAERYTYAFDGRNQAIDHMLANAMLSAVTTYDVVHLNTGYNTRGTGANASPALSDHDPTLASFDFRSLSEVLTGTAGDDTLDVSQGGNDTVSGLGGNDSFYFGAAFTAADTVDGGAGDGDRITLEGNYAGGNALVLGAGTIANIEDIVLLDGFDYSITTVDANVPAGARLRILAGDLKAGDTLSFNGSAETDGSFAVQGGLGADRITTGGGNDLVSAGGGSDVIDGGLGGDRMYGGAGDDTYVVDNASDQTNESAGEGTDLVRASLNHQLAANVENLTLTGSGNFSGAGNALANALTGNSGDNWLLGFQGNDVIDGGLGGDRMQGGADDDIYHVDNLLDRVVEAVGEGTDKVFASVSFQLGADVENLTLTGSASVNGGGNALANLLTGNSGDNWLAGLQGNDVLDGGLGGDRMQGGADDDTYHVDNALDQVIEFAGEGVDRVFSSVSFGLGAEVEHLTLTGSADANGGGNALANQLTGNAGTNWLAGLQGNDVIDGGLGSDRMQGGDDDDIYYVDNTLDRVIEFANEGFDRVIASASFELGADVENLTLTGTGNFSGGGNAIANVLIGNSGGNWLVGLAGNDVIDGGLGADRLDGGADQDAFAFTTALGNGNVDVIIGFVAADDTIRLDDAVFTGLATGALASGAFNTGAAATQVDDRIIYNSSTGALLFDVDGAGGVAAVHFATLGTGLALTSADFVVI